MAFATEELACVLAPPACFVLLVPVARQVCTSEAVRSCVLAWRDLHNLFSAVMSGVAFIAVLFELASRLAKNGGHPVHTLLCAPAEPAPRMVSFWYWSKVYEWVDTLMLLAAGKELGSLHYNHHMTTATVVASHTIGRAVRTSIFDIPMLLNAGVHTVMYAYYWRPQRFRLLRRLITRVQILQHIVVLLCIGYTSLQAARYGSASCDISLFGNGLSLAMFGLYLAQFLSFYRRTYTQGKLEAARRVSCLKVE